MRSLITPRWAIVGGLCAVLLVGATVGLFVLGSDDRDRTEAPSPGWYETGWAGLQLADTVTYNAASSDVVGRKTAIIDPFRGESLVRTLAPDGRLLGEAAATREVVTARVQGSRKWKSWLRENYRAVLDSAAVTPSDGEATRVDRGRTPTGADISYDRLQTVVFDERSVREKLRDAHASAEAALGISLPTIASDSRFQSSRWWNDGRLVAEELAVWISGAGDATGTSGVVQATTFSQIDARIANNVLGAASAGGWDDFDDALQKAAHDLLPPSVYDPEGQDSEQAALRRSSSANPFLISARPERGSGARPQGHIIRDHLIVAAAPALALPGAFGLDAAYTGVVASSAARALRGGGPYLVALIAAGAFYELGEAIKSKVQQAADAIRGAPIQPQEPPEEPEPDPSEPPTIRLGPPEALPPLILAEAEMRRRLHNGPSIDDLYREGRSKGYIPPFETCLDLDEALDELDGLPNEDHHILSNKGRWGDKFDELLARYGLTVDDLEEWNLRRLIHHGRHPTAYHEWVYENVLEIDAIADGDRTKFLKLIKELLDWLERVIKRDPTILRGAYWDCYHRVAFYEDSLFGANAAA